MQYHFKIHQENNAYWAQGVEIPGCFTQGKNLEELRGNLSEALNLAVSEATDSRDFAPLPDPEIKESGHILKIQLDPKIAFSYWVRRLRYLHKLTQKQAAKKMGFSSLYQYQRLESSKYNPTLNTLTIVKSVFPELSLDGLVGEVA